MARELQALVKDLPTVLQEMGQKVSCLGDAVELYAEFTKFVCEW